MKKLIINELSRADGLDGKAKAAVSGDRSTIYLENPAANDVPGFDRAGAHTPIFQRGQFMIFAN
jgi:hypothetical protein